MGRLGRRFPFLFLALLAIGCESRPFKELALADVALRSAQKVKAESLATDEFRKAENFYLRAKKDYTDGYFDSSRKHAEQARLLAEKAEYAALVKQRLIKGRDAESAEP
ncbi:hypothetical protein K2X33_02755 [bacterium]|nr:hypothetical protein [bacterium]